MSIYNPPLPCIYKITNHITNKVYIGSTIKVYSRHYTHINKLIKNTHSNQKLQRSWNKHSSLAFSFQVIELISDVDNLLAREQFYIELYDSINNGFNNVFPEIRTTENIEQSLLREKETRRKYNLKNKEIIKEKEKKYRENNKEKELERHKKYRENNKEKVNEYGRKHAKLKYQENPEFYKMKSKQRYEANKDEINKRRREKYREKKSSLVDLI